MIQFVYAVGAIAIAYKLVDKGLKQHLKNVDNNAQRQHEKTMNATKHDQWREKVSTGERLGIFKPKQTKPSINRDRNLNGKNSDDLSSD